MGLETGTYINSLNASNPAKATDVVAEGADHLQLIKSTIKNTFPNITGALSGTQLDLNSNTYYADTGSANAMVITPSPAISAYTLGMGFRVKPAEANTGAVTLNVNGKGATAVVTASGKALIGAELNTSEIIQVTYNGTSFVMTHEPLGALNNTHVYVDSSGNLQITPTYTRLTSTELILNTTSPTIRLQDSDHQSSFIHCNSNRFYILSSSGANGTTWTPNIGGSNGWPFEIDLTNNTSFVANTLSIKKGDLSVWDGNIGVGGTGKGIVYSNQINTGFVYSAGNIDTAAGVNANGNIISLASVKGGYVWSTGNMLCDVDITSNRDVLVGRDVKALAFKNWYGGQAILSQGFTSSVTWGTPDTGSGYQVFDNGFKIQWGAINTSSSSGTSFTFPTSFSSTSYIVLVNSRTYADNYYARATSASQFNVNKSAGGILGNFYWLAMGY